MPSAETTNFTIRLDTRIKADSEKLFNDLGMSLSSAVNVFLRQALLVQGLPFSVRKGRPNGVTLAAMKEAIALANDPDAKTYASVEDMLQDDAE